MILNWKKIIYIEWPIFLRKASHDAKQINRLWSVTGNRAGKGSCIQDSSQLHKHINTKINGEWKQIHMKCSIQQKKS